MTHGDWAEGQFAHRDHNLYAPAKFSSRFFSAFLLNFAVAKTSARRRVAGPARPDTDYLPAAGFGVWRRDPRYKMSAAHTHSNIELNFLRSGRVYYLHGGVRRTVMAGHLAVFWAGVPHQTLTSAESGDGIWIQLPLSWLLQWNLPRDLAGRLLAGEFFQFEFAPTLPERWLGFFQSGDDERNSVLLLELHASLAGLALELPPAATPAPPATDSIGAGGGDQHISRMTAFIAAHYHDESLTIDDIARVVNLRPHYLTSLFKRRCHVSLWEYVTRLRISHAQRLLVTTDLRVLDVALESGFSSLAPFYNAFARYCGMRPLAFRKRQGQTTT